MVFETLVYLPFNHLTWLVALKFYCNILPLYFGVIRLASEHKTHNVWGKTRYIQVMTANPVQTTFQKCCQVIHAYNYTTWLSQVVHIFLWQILLQKSWTWKFKYI